MASCCLIFLKASEKSCQNNFLILRGTVFVVKLSKKGVMEANWSELNVDDLREAYEKESARLKTSLINGGSWEELKDQRQKVTELAIALHKKIHTSDNPAESTGREEKRVNR